METIRTSCSQRRRVDFIQAQIDHSEVTPEYLVCHCVRPWNILKC